MLPYGVTRAKWVKHLSYAAMTWILVSMTLCLITVTSWWARWRVNHQPHDCLLNHLFRRWSKKTSKLRVTGLCEGNSPVTGEFPAQRASNAETASIWWRHHVMMPPHLYLMHVPHVVNTVKRVFSWWDVSELLIYYSSKYVWNPTLICLPDSFITMTFLL